MGLKESGLRGSLRGVSTGVFPIPDVGKAIYVVGSENDKIYQYNLEEPFDIGNIQFESELEINAQTNSPDGLAWDDTGGRLYTKDSEDDRVLNYSLESDYILSTASFNSEFDISGEASLSRDVEFNSDGSQMYVIDVLDENVHQYNLSTPFDITTASYSDEVFDVTSETNPQGIGWNDDGSVMYLAGINEDGVFAYDLSTPFDITTASYSDDVLDTDTENRPADVEFDTSGNILFIIGLDDNTLYKYNLSTPFDITTASYSGDLFDFTSRDNDCRSIAFNASPQYSQ